MNKSKTKTQVSKKTALASGNGFNYQAHDFLCRLLQFVAISKQRGQVRCITSGNFASYTTNLTPFTFYSMQTMINEAAKYGIDFKEIPADQLPSFELSAAMSLYQNAQNSYSKNPTEENKFALEDVNKFIQDKFVHDSTFGGTGKLHNYSIGDQRGIFYPNDRYLESSILTTRN